MQRVRLQDRAELKEFMAPNTVKGTENKAVTLARLGLKPVTFKAPAKYVMYGGVPCKRVDGAYVPLTQKK